MCDIRRSNFLNNQEAIMCDQEVLKSNATKMPRIILQRAEEVFPALKENLVSVLHRKFNLSACVVMFALCCLQYVNYIKTLCTRFYADVFLVTATYFMHRNIPLPKICCDGIS